MFISINKSNYMSNMNHFKDIGTFPSKKLMPSHVIRNALDDLKIVKCSAHDFIDFFGPNQKSLSLKMAEIWPILQIPCFVISHEQKCTD